MYEEKPALHTMAHIGATAGWDPRAEVGARGQKATLDKPRVNQQEVSREVCHRQKGLSWSVIRA
jgi:hypothetical protein